MKNWHYQSLGVETGVDDAVHVEVEIVELHAVRISSSEVRRRRQIEYGVDHRERETFDKPFVERRNSHSSATGIKTKPGPAVLRN